MEKVSVNPNGWKSLDVKTRIAYISAMIAFFAGWALTIAGFIIGHGSIHDSVLWVLGQALVYSASVFGVAMYTTTQVRGMKRDIREFMRSQSRDDSYDEEENMR